MTNAINEKIVFRQTDVALPLMPAERPLDDSSTAQTIAGLIREEIASGRLAEGAKLPSEVELIKHFGASRPTCREAIRILQSEGLISVSRGSRGGAKVAPAQTTKLAQNAAVLLRIRKATLKDTFEMRLLIEPAAIARLAFHPNKAVVKKLAQIAVAQQFAVEDRVAFTHEELAFQREILESCSSEPLRLFGLILEELLASQWGKLMERLPPHKFEVKENIYSAKLKTKIVQSIAAGEGEKAAEQWRQYLADFVKGLVRHGGAGILL